MPDAGLSEPMQTEFRRPEVGYQGSRHFDVRPADRPQAIDGSGAAATAPVAAAPGVRIVTLVDTQPVVMEGMRVMLGTSRDLELRESADSLPKAIEMVRRVHPAVVVVDKAFGSQALLDWLAALRPQETARGTGIVIWGTSITEAEALRFLQAGARGIVRKSAPVHMLLSCIRTVADGRSWMEDTVFREGYGADRYPRSELTGREHQVLELVEQGMRNKDIGKELGIRPGTVKIHLKHIFEKTGVRGRFGLAINNMKQREHV